MKCLKCGCEFQEGIFCPECGTRYDEEEAKKIEAERQEAENRRKEELKKLDEEKRIQDEIRRQEEKEKRELEIAKAKMEQEKLASERAAHEAELVRQQNEKARIEIENHKKMEEQEKKHQEELARTFNGVLYSSIDEMKDAKAKHAEQVAIEKKIKKANTKAVWSFVLSIATYPLILTVFLWFPSIILSIVFGISSLKEKTSKKGITIASLIIDGFFVIIAIIGIFMSL